MTAVGPRAAAAGLHVGDFARAVDGRQLRDVIDWRWYTSESRFSLTIERDGSAHQIDIVNPSAEPLDVTFDSALFTPIRECENACTFCFVAALPRGLRPSLYVRDDDYRLSFLEGTFVTLTGMDDADVERILTQRLSPLDVSVHAVNPEVRRALIRPAGEDHALEVLQRLVEGGIAVHVQIVLVSGVNSGSVLEETLEHLLALSTVVSVGVVPMGFTRHQMRWTSSWTAKTAGGVIAQLARWQERCRRERGTGWVYAADEFYLLAGVPIPSAWEYDGFPQFENGIGMVSAFREEFVPPKKRFMRRTIAVQATLITGELFAPVLRSLLDGAGWKHIRVLPVRNGMLGGNVSVAGLLSGADIVAAVRADGAQGTYLVPDVVVNSDGLLLDDTSADRLADLAHADVRLVGHDAAALVGALFRRQGRGHR